MPNAYQSRIQLNKHDLSSLKPRVTEYKGVRFRSKSEAVFARCLDLAGADWMYEPFDGRDDPPGEHKWDFLVFMELADLPYVRCGEHWFRVDRPSYTTVEPWFIELKPRLPSATYFDVLAKSLQHWNGVSVNANFGVINGSPWNDEPYELHPLVTNGRLVKVYPEFDCTYQNTVTHQSAMNDLSSYARRAMEYRFDLCNTKADCSIQYGCLCATRL